jgi:uncharacterized protein (DUF697 family)
MFGDLSHQPDPTLRRLAVGQLSERVGYAAAALTLLPVPGTEIIGVVPLHVAMVIGISELHGRTLSQDSAVELVTKIGMAAGVSIVGSRLATTAAKFLLPGLGGLISAPFMYASTLAISAVADAFFAQGGRLDPGEMRDVYTRAHSDAKSSFDPDKAQTTEAQRMARDAASEQVQAPAQPDPVERLQKLKTLLDKGLIDMAEYESTKARILEEL